MPKLEEFTISNIKTGSELKGLTIPNTDRVTLNFDIGDEHRFIRHLNFWVTPEQILDFVEANSKIVQLVKVNSHAVTLKTNIQYFHSNLY